MKEILVLGIGNVLLSDEGVGVRAVNELERRYRFSEEVELLDGGTAGVELLNYLQDRDCLIIIDAIASGQSPGTVVRVEGEDVPATFQTSISPHQLGLSDMLASAMLTDSLPNKMILFGIEPESLEPGLALTETVETSLNKLLAYIVNELELMGCEVTPLNVSVSPRLNLNCPHDRLISA